MVDGIIMYAINYLLCYNKCIQDAGYCNKPHKSKENMQAVAPNGKWNRITL